MTEEIRLIIEKNLPAQVGDVLKQTLDQAAKDSAKVKQLEESLEQKNKSINDKERIISEYQKNDVRNSSLDAREKAIADQERNLKIETLTYQLASEKEKTEFAKGVSMGLVRNLEYRRHLYDNQTEPYKDQYGCTQHQNKTQNSDETKTVS